jgi:hypothetical protein
MISHLALVPDGASIPASDLTRCAAALQRQVAHDFSPLWNVHATVSAFTSLDDVPTAYWPVIVVDQIDDPSALGYHQDDQGQPYAVVKHTSSWQLTASHETLEMLADPFGNRVVSAPSIKPGQGRVQYLVEVCDPCESADHAYSVNGVAVSDFYTPHFFDPVTAPHTRYDFTGAITTPRTILRGGYISWYDPVGRHIWQQVWFGSRKQFRDLGPATPGRSLREQVDEATRLPEQVEGPPPTARGLKTASASRKEIDRSAAARAANLRERIRGGS